MNRRHLIFALCAATLVPTSAFAQGYADQIVQQLRRQGYGGISVSNTWLGRTRIVATSGQGSREIIIDPRTGEILRDLFQGGSGSGPSIVDDSNRSGGGGDDDNQEEDNSGHGGSDTSGSGGSGSGSSDSGDGGSDNDDDDDSADD